MTIGLTKDGIALFSLLHEEGLLGPSWNVVIHERIFLIKVPSRSILRVPLFIHVPDSEVRRLRDIIIEDKWIYYIVFMMEIELFRHGELIPFLNLRI